MRLARSLVTAGAGAVTTADATATAFAIAAFAIATFATAFVATSSTRRQRHTRG